VLVIEDEPRISSFLVKGLERDGCDVVAAEDGEVGGFLATSERFDAVVLDIGLPGTSGLDVLTAIRSHDPALPVLVLTGYDEPEMRSRCVAAGATAFVTKPLVFEQLRATLREQLPRV